MCTTNQCHKFCSCPFWRSIEIELPSSIWMETIMWTKWSENKCHCFDHPLTFSNSRFLIVRYPTLSNLGLWGYMEAVRGYPLWPLIQRQAVKFLFQNLCLWTETRYFSSAPTFWVENCRWGLLSHKCTVAVCSCSILCHIFLYSTFSLAEQGRCSWNGQKGLAVCDSL